MGPGCNRRRHLAPAFVGLGNLPVNWIGLALIGGGLLLVFIELQAPGWGGFGAAGGIAFVLGGFLLFGDSSVPGLPAPDMRVGWAVLGGTAAFMALGIRAVSFLQEGKADRCHLTHFPDSRADRSRQIKARSQGNRVSRR